ncbi:putative single-stranded DNA-binding protein [Helianthus annuus]|nr:putative single-stranded DNA-binding protein [Helianthus annuus]
MKILAIFIPFHYFFCKKQKNYAANGTGSVEELWQAFFANPVDWWDNRKNKVTDTGPTYHIFVHSHTVLIIGGKRGILGGFCSGSIGFRSKRVISWCKSKRAGLPTRQHFLPLFVVDNHYFKYGCILSNIETMTVNPFQ